MAVDGEEIPLAREGVRSLLALLALDVNTVVPLDKIVDTLWGVRPPATARSIVQGYVSRLRKLIEEHAPGCGTEIVTRSPGYLLFADASTVDVHRVRDLLARSRGASARYRAELLAEAAQLWRGTPLADVPRPAPATDLSDLWLAVTSGRIDAQLELGKDVELVSELRELLTRHPYFERGLGQLMRALYRCGRRAEALDCYRRFSRKAARELGIDPGPQLARLYGQVLRDDPELTGPATQPTPVVPAQLPAADAAFTGRLRELEWLQRLRQEPTAVGAATIGVISGQAGVGKSALALTWAHADAAHFDGGQLYASLHGFDHRASPAQPSEVLTRFLLALGVRTSDIPSGIEERSTMYRSLLAGRNMLVVLDDARDSEQVRPLLAGGGDSMVLVTSRRRLAGLSARDGARPLVLDMLTLQDAQRVISKAGIDLPSEYARRFVELCGRLPLALRVMAARLAGGRRDSVERILAELEDERSRLDALRVEGQDTSVHAVLDVSYRRLPTAVAHTIAVLGLLPGSWLGPFELAAMRGITPAEASAHLLELSSANLITELAPARFGMHDLVRLFARERAQELPRKDRAAVLSALLRYYLVVADRARRQLRPAIDGLDLGRRYGLGDGPAIDGPTQALAWFEAQWANLLAVQRSAAEAGMHTGVWQLARLLHVFRMKRPVADDWFAVIESGLRAAAASGDREGEILVRVCRSSYYVMFDDVENMAADAEIASELAQALGDGELIMLTLNQLVGTLAAADRFSEALQRGEKLLVLARASGDRLIESRTQANMAQAELALGRIGDALARQRAAMGLDGGGPEYGFDAHDLANLAELEVLNGASSEAERHARFAADLAWERDLTFTEAFARQVLGTVLAGRGDADAAAAELRRSLVRFREVGSPRAREVVAELQALAEAGDSREDVAAVNGKEQVNRGV